MLLFSECLRGELTRRGVNLVTIGPRRIVGPRLNSHGGPAKWLAYVDKFILFPKQLRRVAQRNPGSTVFHICDHSNAMYVREMGRSSCVVTCHDLLAVRGSLGDDMAFCPTGAMGRVLQRRILRGLEAAPVVACVSHATARDFKRLAPGYAGVTEVVTMGLNTAFKPLDPSEAWRRLAGLPLVPHVPFVLNVGSSLPRKNREACLRILSRLDAERVRLLVFVGQRLTPAQLRLASESGVRERVVELGEVPKTQLEALYSAAHALLFPSLAEGFGWPALEAQACACPVVCSNRTSLPEVVGNAAFMNDPDDEPAFARSLMQLFDPRLRLGAIQAGLENVSRQSTERMIANYCAIYSSLAGRS